MTLLDPFAIPPPNRFSFPLQHGVLQGTKNEQRLTEAPCNVNTCCTFTLKTFSIQFVETTILPKKSKRNTTILTFVTFYDFP